MGIDVNQNLLCFELSKVKTQPHLQKVIMLTVMFLISESVYRAGEDVKDNTAIFIDEAWDLMSGGEIAIFIEKLVRRIRKYKGSLIVGTQSVNDFYKNEAAKACFENSDWRIFMAQKSESIDTLKKESKLSISPFEEKILKSLTKTNNFSELAISGPNTFAIGRLMCDPFSAMLYSSKKEHRERKQKLVQSGMSVIEAIEQARQEFF